MYPANIIANFFIKKSSEKGEPISPMKLLKLIYFAHGWYLAITDQPLIDEAVVAWQYGPVIQSVYNQFKKFGNDPITECAHVNSALSKRLDSDKVTQEVLEKVWDVYGDLTAIQLSNLTHEEGSPWSEVHKQYGAHRISNYPIDNSTIKEYFLAQGTSS